MYISQIKEKVTVYARVQKGWQICAITLGEYGWKKLKIE